MTEPSIVELLTSHKLRGQIKVRREQQTDGTLDLVFFKKPNDYELRLRVDGDRLVKVDD